MKKDIIIAAAIALLILIAVFFVSLGTFALIKWNAIAAIVVWGIISLAFTGKAVYDHIKKKPQKHQDDKWVTLTEDILPIPYWGFDVKTTSDGLTKHQRKLLKEFDYLRLKTEAYQRFITESEHFKALDITEQHLTKKQHNLMMGYLHTLAARMVRQDLFVPKVAPMEDNM